MTLGGSSLRLRLILLVLVAVLPALGLALYSHLEERREGVQQIKIEAFELALAASHVQDHHFEEAQRILSTLANMQQVRRRDAAASASLFSDLLRDTHAYTFIAAADPEGLVFAGAPSDLALDFSDRPWFQRLREQTNGPAVTGYQVERINGKPTPLLVRPVLDDLNRPRAVLAIGLDVEWLNHFMTDFDPPPDSTLTLFDRHGTILAHIPNPEKFVGKSMPESEMVKTALAHGQGTVTTPCLDGILRVHGFVSLGPDPHPLYLTVGITEKVAYAEATPELTRNLTWLGLVGVFALLAAWFGGGIAIVRPVRRLAETAGRLAGGDMTARFGPSSGTNELGQLAHAFDRMADSLQQRQEERDKAEEALRKSEEQYRSITDFTYNWEDWISPAGTYLYVSPSCLRISGHPAQAFVDDPKLFTKILHPEDRDEFLSHQQIYTHGGSPGFLEFRIISASGEVRWISHTCQSIFSNEGDYLGRRGSNRDITEHKLVEETLELSRRTYQDLFEGSTEGIYQLNPDGGLLRVNPALADIYGYETPKAMLLDFGEKGVEALRYDSPDRGREFLYQLWENGSVADFESRIRCREGEIRWISENARLVHDSEGEASRIEGFVEDVTERKRVEEELRENEEKFRSISASAQDAIIIMDNEGCISYWNKAAEKIFGYSHQEAMGQVLHDLLAPKKYLEAHSKGFSLFKTTGQGAVVGKTLELEAIRKDGSIFPIELSLSRVKLGGKWNAIGILRDITERKLAEEERRESENRFRQLAEHLEEVFWLGDQDEDGVWRLLYVNPALEKVFGITPEQEYASNETWLKVLHEDDRERVMKVMESLGDEETAYDIEYRIRWPNSSTRWIWGRGAIVRDEHEKGFRTIEISQDITQRHEMERRTALTQKLESIGQLAAGIAHEINTPTQYVGDNTRFLQDAFKDLNTLLDRYASLLKTAKNEDRLREAAAGVEETAEEIDLEFLMEEIPKAIKQSLDGVERVASIVLAMKKFSHPESDEKKPTDINAAIENTITVARNEWKYVAETAIDLDRELPLVPCFPGDLNQVILNMVVNAAHAIAATEKGTKEKGLITFSTRPIDGYAEIRIRDTGTGIPENARSKVFDPFFTTKDVGKGTGQGLAIAHDIIVDKHGGSILFETEIGKGTEFIIRLPLGDAASDREKNA